MSFVATSTETKCPLLRWTENPKERSAPCALRHCHCILPPPCVIADERRITQTVVIPSYPYDAAHPYHITADSDANWTEERLYGESAS